MATADPRRVEELLASSRLYDGELTATGLSIGGATIAAVASDETLWRAASLRRAELQRAAPVLQCSTCPRPAVRSGRCAACFEDDRNLASLASALRHHPHLSQARADEVIQWCGDLVSQRWAARRRDDPDLPSSVPNPPTERNEEQR